MYGFDWFFGHGMFILYFQDNDLVAARSLIKLFVY